MEKLSASKFIWYAAGSIAVLLVAGIGFFLLQQQQSSSPSSVLPKIAEITTPVSTVTSTAPHTEPTQPVTTTATSTKPPPTAPTLTPPPATPPPAAQPKLYIVAIEADGFYPKVLTVAPNDSVKWINRDSSLHWPASDPHPTHTRYPTLDALGDLGEGETYTFTFTQIGVYGYHDHTEALAESAEIFTGAVKVVAP